jgi:hypothetical protein
VGEVCNKWVSFGKMKAKKHSKGKVFPVGAVEALRAASG